MSNEVLNRVATRIAMRRDVSISIMKDPVIREEPIVGDKPVPPGQAPKPPVPVPDCSQWSYWVTRWEMKRMDTESVGVPVQTGTRKDVISIPGAAPIIMEFPIYTTTWYLQVTITYGQTVQQFNGCGNALTDKIWTAHEATETALIADASNADRLSAGAIAANSTQALAAAQQAIDAYTRSVNEQISSQTSSVMAQHMTGIYSTMEAGLKATQDSIRKAQSDFVSRQERYAYDKGAYDASVDAYNTAMTEYEAQVADHLAWKEEKERYDHQVAIKSSMIREDQVGTQYTVKGSSNLTVTVGQQLTGEQIIASGIQATGGSGYNIDPNTTYIITSVNIDTTRPRPPAVGITGITYPGVINVTRWLPRDN